MKTIKYLLSRIEELAVENDRLKYELRASEKALEPYKSEVQTLKMDIELLKSLIEDQKETIKSLSNENN
jgi:uncharacterized membrane-anchored protein YhcB (DUF1043 family)